MGKGVPYDAAVLVIAVSRDGKIVVVKDPSFKVPFWKLPGGHKKEGESPAECGSRELQEETGIQIPWTKLFGVSSRKTMGHSKYVYMGIVHSWKNLLKIGSDGEVVKIFFLDEILKRKDFLRTHESILIKAIPHLRRKGVNIA
ncbi:MAG: NUDIX hydrolase [Candidatus Yonathbacteria bacterium]|nr:NUDIX hydrolase [Candidatus Yonathbacteria bacterium]